MDRLLSAEEIAELLERKTQWVWAQARAGRIPHVRLGRYRRFRESAVEAWLRDLQADNAPTTIDPAPTPVGERGAVDPADRDAAETPASRCSLG
jgi:excisionase family DNA binding protein